jgi:O-acetylhomoserine/O-acetylserine sulfhydrylase-like pyridoxal-dependent enzyme
MDAEELREKQRKFAPAVLATQAQAEAESRRKEIQEKRYELTKTVLLTTLSNPGLDLKDAVSCVDYAIAFADIVLAKLYPNLTDNTND